MSNYTTTQILESLQKDNQRLNTFVSEKIGVETAENESFTSLIQKAEENYSGGDDESARLYKATIEHDTDVLNEITELPEGIRAIANHAFRDCSGLNLNAIPDSVEGIGEYAFYGCRSLDINELPEILEAIGRYAFYGCTKLKIDAIPSGVTRLEQHTFNRCSSLKTVSSGTVLRADDNVFQNCTSLVEVYLPKMYWVSIYVFHGCTSLKKITLGTVTSAVLNSFRNIPNLEELAVGEGTTSSLYLDELSKLTQKSRHGIIENLADMTGQTPPKIVVHEDCRGIDQEHLDMVNEKNYEHNFVLETEVAE